MTADSVISEDDVRAMIRILGATAALEGSQRDRKRLLMDRLSTLVGADCWVWVLGVQDSDDGQFRYAGYMHGGFDAERLTAFFQAIEHPETRLVETPFYAAVKANQSQTTMLRDEIDTEGKAHRGEMGALWTKARIGPLILSALPLDARAVSGSGLYRDLGRPAFSQRERTMAHLILEEVRWLHHRDWDRHCDVTIPKLYPRQRMVLNLLLDGMTRKRIAAQMGIRENTVSSYVKDIYRHFEVNSHADLMHKFWAGGTQS